MFAMRSRMTSTSVVLALLGAAATGAEGLSLRGGAPVGRTLDGRTLYGKVADWDNRKRPNPPTLRRTEVARPPSSTATAARRQAMYQRQAASSFPGGPGPSPPPSPPPSAPGSGASTPPKAGSRSASPLAERLLTQEAMTGLNTRLWRKRLMMEEDEQAKEKVAQFKARLENLRLQLLSTTHVLWDAVSRGQPQWNALHGDDRADAREEWLLPVGQKLEAAKEAAGDVTEQMINHFGVTDGLQMQGADWLKDRRVMDIGEHLENVERTLTAAREAHEKSKWMGGGSYGELRELQRAHEMMRAIQGNFAYFNMKYYRERTQKGKEAAVAVRAAADSLVELGALLAEPQTRSFAPLRWVRRRLF